MNAGTLSWIAACHLTATLMMVGVIWFVQVVHYPLMHGQAPTYAQEHVRRTSWILAPIMLAELTTALAMAWLDRSWPFFVGLLALLGIWYSTWRIQVPCHNRLVLQFDAAVHRRLVRTNWWRTILWSIRGTVLIGATFWKHV